MLTRAKYAGTIAGLMTGLVLAGCAADSDTLLVGKLLMQQITGEAVQKVSRDEAAAIPYASMGLQLGSGPEALLVLGSATPQELDWYAGDRVVIITRAGRVVRTVGLPYDLGGARAIDSGPPPGGAAAPQPASAREIVYLTDFPDLGIFGARIRCAETAKDNETVTILGGDIAVRHDVEHCIAETMDWRFDNDFWRDPETGYVWRSSQYIHPKSPPVILEVFRPEQNGPG